MSESKNYAQTVAIDRFGRSYHDPGKLASTIMMDCAAEAEAINRGAKKCSQCWPGEKTGRDIPRVNNVVLKD